MLARYQFRKAWGAAPGLGHRQQQSRWLLIDFNMESESLGSLSKYSGLAVASQLPFFEHIGGVRCN